MFTYLDVSDTAWRAQVKNQRPVTCLAKQRRS